MKGSLVVIILGVSVGMSSSGFCKNLGVTGEVFPVKEKNMLDQAKRKSCRNAGEWCWDEIMKSSQERVRDML